MKIAEDGSLVLHQSDIKHYMTCPEQFRTANGIVAGVPDPGVALDRVETDAAVIGTCLHAAIEYDLGVDGPFKSKTAAVGYAKKFMADLVFDFITGNIEYRTESYGPDPEKALGKLEALVETWFTSEERHYWLALINEHPDKVLLEYEFDVPFLDRPGKLYQKVRLGGKPDVIDQVNHRIVDWKSASQPYKRWEKQRWDPQPTVYTYAAATLGLIKPHDDGYHFQYRVFQHGKGTVEEVSVQRDNGQWSWLVKLVSNMVDMIESGLPEWPLRDDHALCGPKWCPNWDSCKGMFVSPDWK